MAASIGAMIHPMRPKEAEYLNLQYIDAIEADEDITAAIARFWRVAGCTLSDT